MTDTETSTDRGDLVAAFMAYWAGKVAERPGMRLPLGWATKVRGLACSGLAAEELAYAVDVAMVKVHRPDQVFGYALGVAWGVLAARDPDPGEPIPRLTYEADGDTSRADERTYRLAEAARAAQMAGPCPRCGVEPGAPCVTASGNLAWTLHAGRITAVP